MPSEVNHSPFGSLPIGRFLAKLFGFSVIPALSIFSPLLIMPVVARVGGTEGWASLGVGQAVGSFGSLVVAAGWTTAGPPRVIASIRIGNSLDIYRVSFWQKAILFAGALLVLIPLTVWLVDGSELTAISACVGALSVCFTLGWYAVGVGSPSISLRYYAIPRTLVTVFSVVPIVLTSNIAWFGVFQFVGSICGPLAFHLREFGSLLPPRVSYESIRTSLSWSFDPGMIELSLAAAGMAVLPVASASQPLAEVARLSSADKLFRYSNPLIDLVGDTLQRWVLSGRDDILRARLRLTIGVQGVLGIVLGGLTVAVGVSITGLLFGSALATTEPILLGYGAAIAARSFSRPLLRNVIIPRGLVKKISKPSSGLAAISIGMMVFLGSRTSFGVEAIAFGYAGYEVAFLLLVILRSVERVSPEQSGEASSA